MSNERFVFESAPHGAGGFAKVRKGRDTVLERDVAVKVLDPLLREATPEDRERFRREARIIAQLSHPNIPAIYDVMFTENEFQIVFEFVAGQNLALLVREQGPRSVAQARTWFRQIASALQHAHDHLIIHRDIKLENIIVSPDLSTAYLVDFGIALSKEDSKKITRNGYIVGTQGYMSPEQEAGEELDARADVYSLAVTLYEVLAGHRIEVGRYVFLSATNEAIPPEIDDLVEQCILPKERRLGSAREFAERLTRALEPRQPLSVVLAQGRLHEMALALQDLTAEDLSQLPAGQRALIVTKVLSVVDSEDENLVFPAAEMLELMVTRGLHLLEQDYKEIASRALTWAFEKVYPFSKQGRPSIQERLSEVCLSAHRSAHKVLCEELNKFLGETSLGDKHDWYLHALRKIISSLLANPEFTGDPSNLDKSLREINQVQRSRGHLK